MIKNISPRSRSGLDVVKCRRDPARWPEEAVGTPKVT